MPVSIIGYKISEKFPQDGEYVNFVDRYGDFQQGTFELSWDEYDDGFPTGNSICWYTGDRCPEGHQLAGRISGFDVDPDMIWFPVELDPLTLSIDEHNARKRLSFIENEKIDLRWMFDGKVRISSSKLDIALGTHTNIGEAIDSIIEEYSSIEKVLKES